MARGEWKVYDRTDPKKLKGRNHPGMRPFKTYRSAASRDATFDNNYSTPPDDTGWTRGVAALAYLVSVASTTRGGVACNDAAMRPRRTVGRYRVRYASGFARTQQSPFTAE